jgi:hypothetical protein
MDMLKHLHQKSVRLAGGWFCSERKYCWLVSDKSNEQGASYQLTTQPVAHYCPYPWTPVHPTSMKAWAAAASTGGEFIGARRSDEGSTVSSYYH